jgi:hypothetical protein
MAYLMMLSVSQTVVVTGKKTIEVAPVHAMTVQGE